VKYYNLPRYDVVELRFLLQSAEDHEISGFMLFGEYIAGHGKLKKEGKSIHENRGSDWTVMKQK